MVQDELHQSAKGKAFYFAREMRRGQTQAEDILWSHLRNRKLKGFKFRRQHPIHTYIADFYCHEAKLVVEVDGEIHNDVDEAQYDAERTYDLGVSGITVIRFKNEEVMGNIKAVLEAIGMHLT